MDKLVVTGGGRLNGEVVISGAKFSEVAKRKIEAAGGTIS